VSFPSLGGTSTDACFPGPEKTQAGDDDADLEKLQELLVRGLQFICWNQQVLKDDLS
jgi:hypothetical protein